MIGTSVALSFGNHSPVQSSAVKVAATLKEVLEGNETQRQKKEPDSASEMKHQFQKFT